MVQASILAECGLEYGLGRIRRSLTLGAALKDMGVDCTVYLTSREGRALASALGFRAKPVSQMPGFHDVLIIDTASHSADTITQLCENANVSCVIDDLGIRPVACDFVINPNLYAETVDYSTYQARSILRAPTYGLVHPDFFDHAHPRAKRSGIVVSYGGTDDGKLALPVAAALAAAYDGPIYIPIPGYFQEVQSFREPLPAQVKILPAPKMASLLGKAELYVGAAGATVLEALAAGCMVCATATQADQHENIRHLSQLKIRTLDQFDPAAIAAAALDMVRHPAAPTVQLNRHAARDTAQMIAMACRTNNRQPAVLNAAAY